MRGRSESAAISTLPSRSRRSWRPRTPAAISANGRAGYQSVLYSSRSMKGSGRRARCAFASVHQATVAGGFRRYELKVIKLSIFAVSREEFLVSALLNDPAVLDYDDPIGAANRGEPMSDHQRGAILHQDLERFLHRAFGLNRATKWPRQVRGLEHS